MSDDEQDITSIAGVGPKRAESLRDAGFETVGDIRTADVGAIAAAEGIAEKRATSIKSNAETGTSEAGNGRPSKLTPAREERILAAAERGAKKHHAAHIGDINPRTLTRWLNRGEEHMESGIESAYADFCRAFNRARARGALERIDNADDEFILERSYGYTKTEKQEIEHSGEIDGSHTVELDSATAAAIRDGTQPGGNDEH